MIHSIVTLAIMLFRITTFSKATMHYCKNVINVQLGVTNKFITRVSLSQTSWRHFFYFCWLIVFFSSIALMRNKLQRSSVFYYSRLLRSLDQGSTEPRCSFLLSLGCSVYWSWSQGDDSSDITKDIKNIYYYFHKLKKNMSRHLIPP